MNETNETFGRELSEGSRSFDLQRLLGIAHRHWAHFLIPMFVGWAAVWGAGWVLPARYKSSTLILVEQPTMPRDYVLPNVNDDLRERLQSITQQILSRTRLEHIIEGLNLYSKDRSHLSQEQLVERMRKDINIELVRDPQNHITAFNIYYSSTNPHVAQYVVSELTNLFINENLEVRQQLSEGTTKFLEGQLETARQALAEQEKQVREFKGQHVGELPGQLGSNLQILAGLQSQLQNEQDALNTSRQQHVYLQTLISQYRSLQASASDGDSPIGLPAIDQELNRLKSELADLSSRYTERHPDVRKLTDQIAKNERMREQLLSELKSKENSAPGDPATEAAMTRPTDPRQATPLVQLESQLQANHIEVQNRERAVAALQNKINEYQSRLNQEPVREQQLTDLTRGYDQSKANYDELLKKKNDSAMATRMELLQQGERFRILDPPSLPSKPDFPNRLKFCALGVVVGLALGAAVVGAVEMVDDRIYEDKLLKDLLPVPVVSEIPAIVTPLDEQQNRRRTWLQWATTAFVFGCILAGSALSYLRG